jgi:hypothetical protein
LLSGSIALKLMALEKRQALNLVLSIEANNKSEEKIAVHLHELNEI